MQIGDSRRWWNRKVPIGCISLIVLVVLAVMWIATYFSDASGTFVWGTTHRWTAYYRGRPLKIPDMWRQRDVPNGQKEIILRRARWGQTFAFEEITIHDDTAFPQAPERVIQNLRAFEELIASVNIDTFVLRDSDVAENYRCIASRNTRFAQRLRVDCVSKDGKWTAMLDGYSSNITDFQNVLKNLSKMGDLLQW